MNKPTNQEIAQAGEDSCKAVEAVVLISRADKWQYGKLKDKLANNSLLGSDQYPDTFEKAMRIGNAHSRQLPSHKAKLACQTKPQRYRSRIHPTRRLRRLRMR